MIGRTVSHQRILAELGRGEAAKARFVREARAASAPSHHDIYGIREIDKTPDCLPQAGKVTLAIHDVPGARVATLVDGEVPASERSVEGAATPRSLRLVTKEGAHATCSLV